MAGARVYVWKAQGCSIGIGTLLVVALGVLLGGLQGVAQANPPVLTSTGTDLVYPAATWSLPYGVESSLIEVANSPLTRADGYFLAANVVRSDSLQATQTTWPTNPLTSYPLAPGVYYLHVGGHDTTCLLCPSIEFSQILPQTIVSAFRAPPPPRPPTLAQPTVDAAGHISLSWTLDSGIEAAQVQIATDPTVDQSGAFGVGHQFDFSPLWPTQTSYTSPLVAKPGTTYYAHVASRQPCCATYVWSNIASISIPGALAVRKPLSLSSARLMGAFSVIARIVSVRSFPTREGSISKSTWTFLPRCSKGACSVQVSLRLRILDKHTLRLRLSRKGTVYRGSAIGTFAGCDAKDVEGTVTARVRVTQGAWVGTNWRATRITGTYHISQVAASGLTHCQPGWVTSTLSGTLAR
jgi:hypothetical protein